jgi:hypothetical protein
MWGSRHRGHLPICSKQHVKKEHTGGALLSESQLPLRSVLKGDFESKDWRKSVISLSLSHTMVCESKLISFGFWLSVRF